MNIALSTEASRAIATLIVLLSLLVFICIIKKMREQEKRLNFESGLLRSLLDNTADLIWFKDEEARFVATSKSHAEFLGISPEDLIGKTDLAIYPEDMAKEWIEEDKKIARGENSIIKEETKIKSPTTGEELWVSLTKVPRYDDDGNPVGNFGIARDITERKKAEEELSFKSNLLSSLLDYLPEAVYFKDEEGRFVEVSESQAEVLGADRDELIGKTDYDFFPEGEAEKMFEDEKRIMEEEEILHQEQRETLPNGDTRWTTITKIPRYDREGNVIGTLGITRDITGQKKAEERTKFLHSLLRHDLRNKAQIVQGYHEALLNIDLPEEGGDFLEKATKANQEGLELIEKVRTLGKIRGEEIREINIDLIIEKVVEENESRASEKGIKIQYSKSELKARGGSLLKELISNLVKNSIQHSECNKIRISSKARDDDRVITVEDDGRGIPDEDKDKVFERGYKKGKSSGSGLGLNLVKRIANQYDGDVQVKDSELGGARFDVILEKP